MENDNNINENVTENENGFEQVTEQNTVQTSEEPKAQETVTSESSSWSSETVTGNTYSSESVKSASYQAPRYNTEYSSANRSEYVYNAPKPKKKGGAGKVAIGIIAAVLAVFVVSVTSISAFVAITGFESRLYVSDSSTAVTDTDPYEEDNDEPVVIEDDETEDSEVETDDSESADSTAVVSTGASAVLSQLSSGDASFSLAEIYEKVSPSVVGISSVSTSGTSTGTGIILTAEGYILTCAHVVEDATSITVVDADMNQYEAALVGIDSQTDIAVLKVDGEDFQPAELGISSDVRVGDLAVVIGNPLGYDLYGSMSAGIISGLNRTLNINGTDMTLIQTDASVNSGNSGGPIINSAGQVIGVISAKVSSSYGEGLGFAIPIDDAISIISDLMEYGYVTGRPTIGITAEDVTIYLATFYRLPQGVYVRYVTPNSGADVAGVLPGDIIVGVNNVSVTSSDELTSIKNNYSVGDVITLNIYRDGIYMDIDVELTEANSVSD